MKLYNKKELKKKRRSLRKNQTDAEATIWYHLRGKRLNNTKFHRQYSVGPYILDFYNPNKRLAIEIDGGQHFEDIQKEYDRKRTVFLEKQNVMVLRFNNLEVLTNTTGVLEKILQYL